MARENLRTKIISFDEKMMIKTYKQMNDKIVDILRLGDEAEQYAAQYIEELQAENAALQKRLDELKGENE